MKYLIYYNDERQHRLVEARGYRELEKWLSESEDCSLTFTEESEAGAVFFSKRNGEEVGFYMESDE